MLSDDVTQVALWQVLGEDRVHASVKGIGSFANRHRHRDRRPLGHPFTINKYCRFRPSGRKHIANDSAGNFYHGPTQRSHSRPLPFSRWRSFNVGNPSTGLTENSNPRIARDRKSTRLNSSHVKISYAV